MAGAAEIVVCGAGMAGIAAAYHISVRQGARGVTLIDEREPLTLTSDKGTEAYRNWWPGPDDTMLRLMNRSIDLLEELARQSDNAFAMNRRGYLFLSGEPSRVDRWRRSASELAGRGAGALREHPGPLEYRPSPASGFEGVGEGADLLTDPRAVQRLAPFATPDTVAALHVRRAGWLDAARLGRWLLQRCERAGVSLLRERVEAVDTEGGRVRAVRLASGRRVETPRLVIAAGPYLGRVAAMLGIDAPVATELHAKIAIRDEQRILPPGAPLTIWSDPLRLIWSDDERRQLGAREDSRRLLDEFPSGVHFRPRGEGNDYRPLIIWNYAPKASKPDWPPRFDPLLARVMIRGLARMVPALRAYFGREEQAEVSGGYYCKTRENRPLIGPLPVEGAFVVGALSGFGIMGSQAAAELLAAHVTGGRLPDYASAFRLERYDDPDYVRAIERWDPSASEL